MLSLENYKVIKTDDILDKKISLLNRDNLKLSEKDIKEIYLLICTDYDEYKKSFNEVLNKEKSISTAFAYNLFKICLGYLISKNPHGDIINTDYLIHFFENLIDNKQQIEDELLKPYSLFKRINYFYQRHFCEFVKSTHKDIWIEISSNSELFLFSINKNIQYLKESKINKYELILSNKTKTDINNMLSQLDFINCEKLNDERDLFSILKLIKSSYNHRHLIKENSFYEDAALEILFPIFLYLVFTNSKKNKHVEIEDAVKVLKYYQLISIQHYSSLFSTFLNIDVELIKHIHSFEGYKEHLEACGRKYFQISVQSEKMMGVIVETAIDFLENLSD